MVGIFRTLFKTALRRCIVAKLVEGKDVALGASFIAIDASWHHKMWPADL